MTLFSISSFLDLLLLWLQFSLESLKLLYFFVQTYHYFYSVVHFAELHVHVQKSSVSENSRCHYMYGFGKINQELSKMLTKSYINMYGFSWVGKLVISEQNFTFGGRTKFMWWSITNTHARLQLLFIVIRSVFAKSKEIILLKVHFPMKIVELLDVVVQNSLGVNFDVSSCRSH